MSYHRSTKDGLLFHLHHRLPSYHSHQHTRIGCEGGQKLAWIHSNIASPPVPKLYRISPKIDVFYVQMQTRRRFGRDLQNYLWPLLSIPLPVEAAEEAGLLQFFFWFLAPPSDIAAFCFLALAFSTRRCCCCCSISLATVVTGRNTVKGNIATMILNRTRLLSNGWGTPPPL